jgi:hypothetical protein
MNDSGRGLSRKSYFAPGQHRQGAGVPGFLPLYQSHFSPLSARLVPVVPLYESTASPGINH